MNLDLKELLSTVVWLLPLPVRLDSLSMTRVIPASLSVTECDCVCSIPTRSDDTDWAV